jgi:hypothetical protein
VGIFRAQIEGSSTPESPSMTSMCGLCFLRRWDSMSSIAFKIAILVELTITVPQISQRDRTRCYRLATILALSAMAAIFSKQAIEQAS